MTEKEQTLFPEWFSTTMWIIVNFLMIMALMVANCVRNRCDNICSRDNTASFVGKEQICACIDKETNAVKYIDEH